VVTTKYLAKFQSPKAITWHECNDELQIKLTFRSGPMIFGRVMAFGLWNLAKYIVVTTFFAMLGNIDLIFGMRQASTLTFVRLSGTSENWRWYNKRVLIWSFTLVLIKINYGQIGDQTGLFYTTNPVFYTSGNIFVFYLISSSFTLLNPYLR
jgi:hypothetical protein